MPMSREPRALGGGALVEVAVRGVAVVDVVDGVAGDEVAAHEAVCA